MGPDLDLTLFLMVWFIILIQILEKIQRTLLVKWWVVPSHAKQVEAGRMAPLDKEQAQSRVAASEAALFAARNTVTEPCPGSR